MQDKRPGRPPNPVDPDASNAARLGAEIRKRRLAEGLTLEALGELIDYSIQHISDIELGKSSPSRSFITACDRALDAQGEILDLLPAVVRERAMQRHDRASARRVADRLSLRWIEEHSEAGEDVDPTSRRDLLGTGAAATLGAVGVAAAPGAAREIDPELPVHFARLLDVLARHDEMFGPREVLDTVQYQLRMIAQHREVARGELRTRLLRVEARWAEFAAWLNDDTGQSRSRDAWTDHALRLAREAHYPDMVAYARSRQSQWAAQEQHPGRAVALSEDALRTRGASAQIRAWCALRAAIGHALANNTSDCERYLNRAYGLAEQSDSPAPPWAGEFRYTATAVRAGEARCWIWMQPSKAIPLYERALREWPRDHMRTAGVFQARLALACAAAGERDRAETEGKRALAIARATKSATATRELKQLGLTLSAD